mmetsp:Transcript_78143/g.246880  ORF Transcript_78143/g.246880 Transcript_78143/m.246880 type:complete len:269 (+) Transcript_78143:367-1173(+)
MYGLSVIASGRQEEPSLPSSSGGQEAEAKDPCASREDPNFLCINSARSAKSVPLKKPSNAFSACTPASLAASRRSTLKLMGKPPSSCASLKWSINSSKAATRRPLISTIWSPTCQPLSSACGLQKPTMEVPCSRSPSVWSSSSLSTSTWRRWRYSPTPQLPGGATPPRARSRSAPGLQHAFSPSGGGSPASRMSASSGIGGGPQDGFGIAGPGTEGRWQPVGRETCAERPSSLGRGERATPLHSAVARPRCHRQRWRAALLGASGHCP